MKPIKMFEQFVNESKVSFSKAVLNALNPTLLQITERIKASIAEDFEKQFGYEKQFNEWEVEMIKLKLIVDLFTSFQNYIYDTDQLVSIIPHEGPKGIEIKAVISRDGQEYNYFTSAIYAGGFNIQRLHLRYLVKTELPKIKSDLAREYEQKYKNLTKAEKFNAQIKETEEKINKAKEHLEWAQTLTDDEKIKYSEEKSGYARPTWQTVIDNGAAGNFNDSEEEFNKFMKDSDESSIKRFNLLNIESKISYISSLEKDLIRLNAKLQKLL